MTLKAELMEIQGVGESRAERIMQIVDEYQTDTEPMGKALSFLEKGKPRIAQSVLEDELTQK
jgi:hypothetical protein